MYLISAHDIESFYRCRESFRQSFYACCNREAIYPAIHMEFGSAIHAGCEAFWLGKTCKEAFAAAVCRIGEVDVALLTAKDAETWKRLLNGLPEMLGAYFEHFGCPEDHKLAKGFAKMEPLVEHEWGLQTEATGGKVMLVGKLDHVFDNPVILRDIKTASEIGNWRKDLANQQARSTQFQLYDWFLCQSGLQPFRIDVEVITKPYRGSKAKVAILPITEPIIAGRRRFAAQLQFKCQEMAHWLDTYGLTPMAQVERRGVDVAPGFQRWHMRPWPMADSWVCKGVYGPCPFMRLCLEGESPEALKDYQPRKEHLAIRKGAT